MKNLSEYFGGKSWAFYSSKDAMRSFESALQIIDDTSERGLCNLYKVANEFDPEELAAWLCKHFDLFRLSLERNAVARRRYAPDPLNRTGECTSCDDTNQKEKNLAKAIHRLWNTRPHRIFGRVLSYEIPLEPQLTEVKDDCKRAPENEPFEQKERKPNERLYPRGRIDLVSLRRSDLFILELKNEDSDESYIRCLLESYTYLKTIKRRSDFLQDMASISETRSKPRRIVICPLLFSNPKCKPNTQFESRGNWVRELEGFISSDPDVNGVQRYVFTPCEEKRIFEEYNRILSARHDPAASA